MWDLIRWFYFTEIVGSKISVMKLCTYILSQKNEHYKEYAKCMYEVCACTE